MQSAATHQAISDGINVAGYFQAELGVGAAARGYVRALQQAGIPVALNNVDIGVQSRKNDQSFGEFATNNPYPINLVCVNADQVQGFVENYGEDYFRGKYNIAVWWWELQEFPVEFWQHFRWFDEIWVGTRFIQHSLSRCSPVPVLCVPPSLELPTTAMIGREALGVPSDEFLFLFMFDFLSVFERKNPLALIKAFRSAFAPQQPVRLILKCINSQKEPEKLRQIKDAIGDARITLLDQYFSRHETISLISACDAYASLHRSEGLGLPLAEAMLLRKPVIATGWSGNIDFMTNENSFPVPFKLTPNETDAGPYRAGEVWAEADINAAVVALREVFTNRDGAALKAAQAAMDVKMHFGPAEVGAEIKSRLQSVRMFHPYSQDSEQSKNGIEIPNSSASPERGRAPSPFLIDETTAKQLDIISGSSTAGSAAETGKGILRRLVMPLVERAGYLNSIYSQLLKKLFLHYGQLAAKINLIDDRSRRANASNETRIAALEEELKRLRQQHNDKI